MYSRYRILSANRLYWMPETGYRLLDTASSYKNEEVVGSAVKKAISTGVVNEKNCLLPLRHIFSRWDMKRLYRLFMSR